MEVFISLLAYLVVFVGGEESSCDPDNSEEVVLSCPMNVLLINRMHSLEDPFFTDSLVHVSCNIFQGHGEPQDIYNDDEAVFNCFSVDGALTMDCECPKNQVIHTIKMCLKDNHAVLVSLHCRSLKEFVQLGDRFDVTSADHDNKFVGCGEDATVQRIQLSDAGDGAITKVDFTCVSVKSKSYKG